MTANDPARVIPAATARAYGREAMERINGMTAADRSTADDATFEAALYPPEVAVCRDGCEVCPPRAPARSASPAPDETEVEVERVAQVLAARLGWHRIVVPGDVARAVAADVLAAALAARVPADDPAAAVER